MNIEGYRVGSNVDRLDPNVQKALVICSKKIRILEICVNQLNDPHPENFNPEMVQSIQDGYARTGEYCKADVTADSYGISHITCPRCTEDCPAKTDMALRSIG